LPPTPDSDRDVRVGLTVPQGLLERFRRGTMRPASAGTRPSTGASNRPTTVRVSRSDAMPFWLVSVFDFDPHNPVADVDVAPVVGRSRRDGARDRDSHQPHDLV